MNNLQGTGAIYDTMEGIKSFLIDLDGLNKLKQLRNEAYYIRKEKLNEYIVLGRFLLGAGGNFSILIKEGTRHTIPAEDIRDIPSVISYESVFKYLKPDSSICSTSYSLPPTYAKCSICDEPWSIKDCHETIQSDTNIHYDLNKFVGQKLGDINELPEYIHRFKHYISHDLIGSDNYINKADGNIKGWKNVNKDYIIKPDDKCSLTIVNFTHTECNKLNTIETSLIKFKSLFTDAGYSNVILNGIANRYFNSNNYESYAPPWYIAKINGADPIIIGWRKSVININWSKSGIDLLHLFESENVTKDTCMIHAHGYDKAIEYLKKIIPQLIKI